MPALSDSRAVAAWRKSADRLRKLEEALIASQWGPHPESSFGQTLDEAVKKARTTADRLYQDALEQSTRAQSIPKQ